MLVNIDPFKKYLFDASESGISDVTLTPSESPKLRAEGNLTADKSIIVEQFELDAFIFSFAGKAALDNLREGVNTEPLLFSADIDGLGECRCSAVSLVPRGYIVTVRLRMGR